MSRAPWPMKRMRIRGAHVLDPHVNKFVEADITADRGVITEVVEPRHGANSGRHEHVINAQGCLVAPGFIDLQVNGGWGHDLTEDPSLVWSVARRLPEVGVTSWLPTLVSADSTVMGEALSATKDGAPAQWVGAEPVGWHFEGPWLAPERRGAHPAHALGKPPEVGSLASQAHLVTLAPELPGALDFIAALTEAGVVVSVGHSNATSAQTFAAFDHGATMGTHLFNAMSGLHHREPGVAAAVLDDDRAHFGLIADGHHCAPEIVRLAWAAAGDRLILVSDAMANAGLGDGTSSLSSQQVTVKDGAARLADGTLAGSVISIRDAVAQFVAMTGCTTAQALSAASQVPARAMGFTDRGQLLAGKRVDIVILNEDLRVQATIVAGDIVFATPEFRDRQEQP